MVDPCVSNSIPSSAVFKVNSISWVGVGVCLPSIVASSDYKFDRKFRPYADNRMKKHSLFMILNNGDCYAQDKPRTPTDFKFSPGSEITVEWNPAKQEVNWSIAGTDKRNVQSVPLEILQQGPLHFVVVMNGKCDVSLVA